MQNDINECYFNMAAEALRDCFTPPKNSIDLESRLNIDKTLVKLFCDCSHNFEYSKLIENIYLKNRYFKSNIWYLR